LLIITSYNWKSQMIVIKKVLIMKCDYVIRGNMHISLTAHNNSNNHRHHHPQHHCVSKSSRPSVYMQFRLAQNWIWFGLSGRYYV